MKSVIIGNKVLTVGHTTNAITYNGIKLFNITIRSIKRDSIYYTKELYGKTVCYDIPICNITTIGTIKDINKEIDMRNEMSHVIY